jgi:iron(III) transport system permease protein
MELAAAQSALLALVSILFFTVFTLQAGPAGQGRTGKGSVKPGMLRLGRWAKRLLVFTGALIIGLELLPVLMIVLLAFAKEGSWTWQILPAQYTLDNFTSLLRDPGMGLPIENSLLMATLAVVACAVLGFCGAYLMHQVKGRRRGILLDTALTFPFAIPGTVVAIALILAFNSPVLPAGGVVLVGTFAILPLAYVIRMYPIALRSIASSFAGIERPVVEAAESLGAGPWRRFRTVLLPLLLPGVVGGALLVAVSALGEFVSSILLYSYDSRPISVEILARLRAFDVGAAAAYSVVLLLLVLGLVSLAGWFTRRRGASVGGSPFRD